MSRRYISLLPRYRGTCPKCGTKLIAEPKRNRILKALAWLEYEIDRMWKHTDRLWSRLWDDTRRGH